MSNPGDVNIFSGRVGLVARCDGRKLSLPKLDQKAFLASRASGYEF